MDNSRNTFSPKNNFPWFNSFPSAMSCFHITTKMRFRGNPRKTVELQNYIKSWKMVVRSWYMTHFDRRDLLKSKKIVSERFRNIPGLPGSIFEIFRFIWDFCKIPQVLKIRFFELSSPKKIFKNDFHKISKFSLKLWYLSSILVYLLRADSQ